MPNIFAYITLISWPLLSLFFYKRYRIVEATFFTIFFGYLILPVRTEIDFPLIPALDKESIPVISALIGCVYIKKIKLRLLPSRGLDKWMVLTFFISPIFTWINNTESVRGIPGLAAHDAISSMINTFLFLLPYLIVRNIVTKIEDQVVIFKLIVLCALVYSLPILFEIRMSPQLHSWTYGYFPHIFLQQIREGGYRPVVFLGHGLLVAIFIAVSIGAASTLQKCRQKLFGIPLFPIILYLFVILVLCKTLGALIIGIILLLSIYMMPFLIKKYIVIFLAAISILYPFLSLLDFFPHQYLVDLASQYDSSRGQSLAFRFMNENILLTNIQDKLLFGWGGWGRYRLDESVTDGFWIITLGERGLVGFICIFGLLFNAVWNAIKVSSSITDPATKYALIGHALIVSVIMIDQIPNSSLYSWSLFIAGALSGVTDKLKLIRINRQNPANEIT